MILAHLSDLHIGKSDDHREACLAIRDALLAQGVDHVIVTGDITEHGLAAEYQLFKTIFSGLLISGKMTILPGNHDRLKDEVARGMLDNRVNLMVLPGFRLISVDSTGPQNRWRHAGHGTIDEYTVQQIIGLVKQAAPSDFVAVAMHHHLFPLPEDLWLETVSDFLRLPFAAELKLGRKLLDKLLGHCDLVLHGHRHSQMDKTFQHETRSLGLYNAGSSTRLRGFRIFAIEGGKLTQPPTWIDVEESAENG